MIVELEVRDNIPYLKVGSEDCRPKVASNTHSIPCAVNALDVPEVDSGVETHSEPVATAVDTDGSA